jgi:hypothetical protein
MQEAQQPKVAHILSTVASTDNCTLTCIVLHVDARRVQGATDAAIESIPEVTVEADTLRHTDGDSTCPICLSDMALGEKVRIMPCKHVFHSQVR